MINRPHALYYNGELVAIVLNPDPYPGGIAEICDQLSPYEGLADAITIPTEGAPLQDPDQKGDVYDPSFLWFEIRCALRQLHVAETIESTASQADTIVVQVCDNDDRFYRLPDECLAEAVQQPRESRMAWLRERWKPTSVHTDSDVDVVIVPDDYEGWEAFEEFAEEYTE